MTDIPVKYEEVNPFEVKAYPVYFSVSAMNEVQVKNMIRLNAVVPMSNETGIPFIKEGLEEPIFRIKGTLDAYISMLHTFRRTGVFLTTPKGTRQVVNKDLLKFIFE